MTNRSSESMQDLVNPPTRTKVSANQAFLLLTVTLLVLAGVFVGFYLGQRAAYDSIKPEKDEALLPNNPQGNEKSKSGGVMCTYDAKICPDGSSVGRIPPTCEFAPCPVAEPVRATIPDGGTSDQSSPRMPAQNISIPASWSSQTAVDPAFLTTTTLSLPPGYTFTFSGSEFTIANSDFTDAWDYNTSVFIGKEELQNYYSGESRRAWLAKYLRGDFNASERADSYPVTTITSVTEYPIGERSYLLVTLKTAGLDGVPHRENKMYVIEQNGMVHMLKFASGIGSEKDSIIAKNMGAILYSLRAQRTAQ